jgi:alpha-L-rhamnosidase
MNKQILRLSFLIICAGMVFSIGKTEAQVQLKNLRCEMRKNPEGIDARTPRLSWELEGNQRGLVQQAFQVLVASSEEKLKANQGDIWNSDKIVSAQSIQNTYQGEALKSRTRCFWKVKVWTNQGESEWSDPARWTMGLLDSTDWSAKWIGLDNAMPWDSVTKFSRLSARYLRKEFSANKEIKRATAYIVGLGLYEMYINGKRIGDQVLAPAPTNYTEAALYNTFDVTSNVKKGLNAVGVVLSNGRYFTMRQNYKPKKIRTYGFPKMLVQVEIEFADGSKQIVASDETWKLTADGPIRSANEYDGEDYDATKELTGWTLAGYNDSGWGKAEKVASPGGKVVAQANANMKIMETVKPVSIKQLNADTFIMDIGQNLAGWIRMKVKGTRGQVVKLKFAENIQPNGRLYIANLRDAITTDSYTLKGGAEETWEPAFVYHGFRYVQIAGYPGVPKLENFEACLVYDEMESSGTFQTSNPVLNQIYRNAWWGIASNYKGMPVDCPQRNERQPWLGDHATGSYGESFMFGNHLLYAKWLDDIEQSQTPEGQIPDVAPAYWNYYSDNVTWPGSYLIIANTLYRQFGDRQCIVKHYPSMKKWMNFIRTKYLKDGLITRDKYGDWCLPPESPELIHSRDSMRNTNGELLASAYYYKMLNLMTTFAGLAGVKDDSAVYSRLADSLKVAFNAKFFNANKKQYDNNTVTANLLPLYFGMVPDSARQAVFGSITEKIIRENKGHISTGVIGSQWMMRGLTEFGRSDIAYRFAINTDYPSWGYMIKNGATAIWELWNGNTANPWMNSQNHVMLLGDLLIWCYENLAGIKTNPSAPGFKQLIMKPELVDGLKTVNATYKSAHGWIKSNWENDIAKFDWKITIPGNSSAIIYIPASSEKDVTEGGKPATSAPGVKFLRMEGKLVVFEIGSGDYIFSATKKWKSGILKDEFIFTESTFPESHGSTVAETPKGLVTAWFGGTKEANPDCAIYVSRNENGMWTAPVQVANGIQNDTLRYACWNPVLYQIPGGELMLFYKIGKKVASWTGWYLTSKDNGITWGKPQALPQGFIGPVKNKPVLLSNGTLLCPSSTEGSGWKVHFEATTDWGKTWQKIGPINDGKEFNAIQPSILTYSDGRIQVLCRSRNRAILESSSLDMGKTWSPMSPVSLPNNNSGTDAVTLTDGRQLLVYNHVLPPNGMAKGPRTPLNVSVSKDGKTWEAALVLEDSPISQYSYPSVIQSKDGKVHIVYTWRRERIKHVVVDPVKLQPVKIENGVWPGMSTEVKSFINEE